MKFQAAAMARANIPESERQDFSLFVDEFQNFATDSFESILSEARKYRLNLVLGNQFMTQLTDKIREAIIGNVGTVISGRIGITDAEVLIKKFAPTFEAEDLTKMPNHESITSVMINNVPSAPFSMAWVPRLGEANSKLNDALKQLSAAKYGKPRALVEKTIFDRLGAAEKEKKDKRDSLRAGGSQLAPAAAKPAGSSFLDEWLSKRQQLSGTAAQSQPGAMMQPQAPTASPVASMQPAQQPQQVQPPTRSASYTAQAPIATSPAPFAQTQPSFQAMPTQPSTAPLQQTPAMPMAQPQTAMDDKLHIRGNQQNTSDEVAIKLR